jgi:hypothetical protein
MKLRSQFEGLAVVATIAAVLAKDTLLVITGDKTVNAAGAGATVVGRLMKPARTVNDFGTVETRFKERIEIQASVVLVAGDKVKMAAADGSGNQQVAKWIAGTDTSESLLGVCWVGAGIAGTAEVLVF